MKARELCFIAVIASIEAVVFTSFSFILYLECITFTIVVFAMTFQTRQAVLGAVVFTILNLSTQGVAPWSMMYCLIYPLYSLFIGCSRKFLNRHFLALVFTCGFLSFLTDQLVQLPFMLISGKITAIYILMGLKTSLIQGFMSMALCAICYKPIAAVLNHMERRLQNGKAM